MRKSSSVFVTLLIALPLLCLGALHASSVRVAHPEVAVTGDEPAPRPSGDTPVRAPRTPVPDLVGTVIDSTYMDHQSNATIHQRIAAVGDSALHVTAMVATDDAFSTRGMRYYYYINGVFTNYGFVEGSGSGDQRGGYGAVVGYYEPTRGIGNVAVVTTHTNLASRAYGSHWYDFQDAFQGVGAFTPYEGFPGDGVSTCDRLLWPSLYVSNDPAGHMAMTGITFDATCQGGLDDVSVIAKDFDDATWGDPVLLDTWNDPGAWNNPSGGDIPMLAGADNGEVAVATTDFGTNVYLWESTDFGVTWGARENITGYPQGPQGHVPPDENSEEYRPLQNSALAIAPDGTPHVVWTSFQARGNADSVYTPGTDGVWQYRTKLEHWDPIHGVTTVYRHPVGLADQVQGTAFAYNVGHPSIGFDESGQVVYVVYEGFIDADVDPTNGLGYGDVYTSISLDGGATWDDRINLTDSPGADDLYPAIARINPQGILQGQPGFSAGAPDGINDFVIIYQDDDVAGTWLRGEEPAGNWDKLLVAPVDVTMVVGIGDDGPGHGAGLPRAFALDQNYPNPFNPATTITYRLAEASQVRLRIHNIRGQVVRDLVSTPQEPGEYSVQWDGKDAAGRTVSSGIYLYTLETDQGLQATRKMIVLK